jgi:hypothetical protein
MPSAKNGTSGSLVSPAAPREALEADQADPGEVTKAKAEQLQTKTGKYGSAPLKAHSPAKAGATDEQSNESGSSTGGNSVGSDGKPKKKVWIEIELVDKDNKPVAGEAYRVTLPDGETVAEGTLDEKGFARVDGIDPGSCKITFPKLEKQAWKPK